jgi:hypothetical protein
MRDQRLHVQRTCGLKRGSRGSKGVSSRRPQAGGLRFFGAEWSCFAVFNIGDSYTQACMKLASGLLYRVELDHMINLQGRFVEMMAKQLCLVRHIVYLWLYPNNMRSRRGRLIFMTIISNRPSAAWVEGQQGTRKSVATINHDVLPRTLARLLVKKLARDPATDYTGVDPILGCDKKEEVKNLLQPGVLVLLSIGT